MMTNLKSALKVIFLIAVCSATAITSAKAQDAEVTDDELKAYIIVMDSIDAMKANISEEMSRLVKEHELMDQGRVYNQIKAANADTAKLTEAGITPEQIAAYQEIQVKIQDMEKQLNDAFVTLVKEDVGVAAYNKIKKGLRSDEELKGRYEEIKAEIAPEEEVEEGTNDQKPKSADDQNN